MAKKKVVPKNAPMGSKTKKAYENKTSDRPGETNRQLASKKTKKAKK